MKINIPNTYLLYIMISISCNCYSQNGMEYQDTLFVNWISESIRYAEKNYEILPDPFPSILFNGFNSLENSSYEGRNWRLLKFLEEYFSHDLRNSKVY